MESIFEFAMTVSFLMTLIVTVRVYNAVRLLNARVSLLHEIVQGLPGARAILNRDSSTSPMPAGRVAKDVTTAADRTTFEVDDDTLASLADTEKEVRRLEQQLARDFSLPPKKAPSKPPAPARASTAQKPVTPPSDDFATSHDPLRRMKR